MNELHIRPIRKRGMPFQQRSDPFDVGVIQFVDEKRTMRIAGRAGGDGNALAVNRQRVIHDSVHWRSAARNGISLGARCGTPISASYSLRCARSVYIPEIVSSWISSFGHTAGLDQVCCDTAQPVARTFGFTAVTIENPQLERRRRPASRGSDRRRRHRNIDRQIPFARLGIIGRNGRSLLDENEVVSERLRLNKRNHAERPHGVANRGRHCRFPLALSQESLIAPE